jgi:flagellar hook-basal body complex protein FliE
MSSALMAIQGVAPPDLVEPAAGTAAPLADNTQADRFGAMVSQGLEAVNRDLMTSQVDLQQLATGNAQNLHEMMIRLEEGRLSFQLLMQVRGRLLEAYQDVMRMQV